MVKHLPIEKRVFFPKGLADRHDESVIAMLAALTQQMEEQYGIQPILGAEQEFSIGQIAVHRTPRGDRYLDVWPKYDTLVMGEHPIFSMPDYMKSSMIENSRRQFVLSPEAQRSQESINKLLAELEREKRTELASIISKKLSQMDSETPKEHLNHWLNELQLMGDTIAHRQQFIEELNNLRALQKALASESPSADAIRDAMRNNKADIGRIVLSLAIDPNETMLKPEENLGHNGQK